MTGYQTTNHAKKMPNVYVSFPWWRATDHWDSATAGWHGRLKNFSRGGTGGFSTIFLGRGLNWWNLFFPTRKQENNFFCWHFQNPGWSWAPGPSVPRKYFWETALCYKCAEVVFWVIIIDSELIHKFPSFNTILNSKGNRIVGGKLVRPTISCRNCIWHATRERLPTLLYMNQAVLITAGGWNFCFFQHALDIVYYA